ncbi:MAG: VCBS repeat-containing protein [Burkholderiales bacterium]|nr:VCBS repeat-containing protein [Burkholderiales bacterium]
METTLLRIARPAACLLLAIALPAAAVKPVVSVGGIYTVVLRSDGSVWQWGAQPGIGGAIATSPVPVQGVGGFGVLRDINAISAGRRAALALSGQVYAWGQAPLGDGTTNSSPTPILVTTCATPTAVSAGNNHYLVRCLDGTVVSWGANSSGQVGVGSTAVSQYNTAQTVVGVGGAGTLSNVTAIAAGYNSSYALRGDGTVVAWGYNDFGQLGDGTITSRSAPVAVVNVGGAGTLSGVVAIAAGRYWAMALKNDGTVVAWGYNGYGQLGNGTTNTPFLSPNPVSGVGGVGTLSGITAIGAGGAGTSYAIDASGKAYAWGNNNDGLVGDGTTAQRLTPVPSLLPPVTGMDGALSDCLNCNTAAAAMTPYGLVKTWGNNDFGQLGNGTTFAFGARTIPDNALDDSLISPFYAKVGTDAGQPRGDLSGDLRSDVLWRQASSGALYFWGMNGRAYFARDMGVVGAGWEIAGAGDFNGDGFADILWRHADGSNYIWFMYGPEVIGQGYTAWAGPEWSVLSVNDFDGDGKADIFWRRTGDGALVLWPMAGLSVVRTQQAGSLDPAVWSFAGSGDLNGDGIADILWRDTGGAFYGWVSGNSRFSTNYFIASQGALPNPGLEWQVAAIADLGGDGKADIVFRRTTDGANYLWRMNGLSIASQAALPAVGLEWSLALVGDLDGDARNDFIFRRTDGVNYAWLMNDATIADQGTLPAIDASWAIVKPK